MKSIVTVCIALLMTFEVSGQDLFTSLTEKYSGKEGFSATNLTPDMFNLYLKKKQVDPNSPVYETLRKLNHILVVSQSSYVFGKSEEKPAVELSEIHKTILSHYKARSFTLFKTENRMGEDLKVYLQKNDEKITSLAMVTASATQMVLVELEGEIDLGTLADLSSALNISGLENLRRISDRSGGPMVFRDFGDYSFNFGNDRLKQMEQMEQQMKVLNELRSEEFLNKQQEWMEKGREFTEKHKEFAQQQREMAERAREMAEKYGRHPIILSAPGDTNVVYIIDGKKASAREMKNIDPERIAIIEVIKADKNKPSGKGEVRITTRKK